MMFCLLNCFCSASIRQCYPSLSKANSRSLSIKKQSKYKILTDPSVHKVVYSFDYIRISARFLASKLYLPLGSVVVGSCASIYLSSWELVVPIIWSNAIHLTFMAVATKFLNNTVGAVFVNREGKINEVIFSAIDNWGRRVDRKHKVDDIVTIDGAGLIMRAGFFIVAIQNSDIRYKVNFKDCRVHDHEACKIVFDDYDFLKTTQK